MTELGQKPAGLECIPYCCYHEGARLRDQSQEVVAGQQCGRRCTVPAGSFGWLALARHWPSELVMSGPGNMIGRNYLSPLNVPT